MPAPSFLSRLKPARIFTIALYAFITLSVILFIRDNREEWRQMPLYFDSVSGGIWMLGIAVTFFYVLAQAMMFRHSYQAYGVNMPVTDATPVFLKRNFASLFLPLGGVSMLAYWPLRQRKYKKMPGVHTGSALYGVVGILSLVITAIPPLIALPAADAGRSMRYRISWLALALLVAALLWLFRALQRPGWVRDTLHARVPALARAISSLTDQRADRKGVWWTLVWSFIIEVCGIFHLYLAIYAVTGEHHFWLAWGGYAIATVCMAVMPLFRGLGVVEASLVGILAWQGIPVPEATAIMLIYRVWEFWLPLALGVALFLYEARQLLYRLIPPVMMLVLGCVNIISVLTPPNAARLRWLYGYRPIAWMTTGNYLALLAGLGLVITAYYLWKGHRTAWWVSLCVSLVSCVAHLLKAWDYEESIMAFVVVVTLLSTYRNYSRGRSRLWRPGNAWLFSGIFVTLFVSLTVSVWLLDHRHFGTDFTWYQSVFISVKEMLLLPVAELKAQTRFGVRFLSSIHFLVLIGWCYTIWKVLQIQIQRPESDSDFQRAQEIVDRLGSSALDHFKVQEGQHLFFAHETEGFISYKLSNRFAIVLESAVCRQADVRKVLNEFEEFCRKKGWRTAYYRVDESAMLLFRSLNKRKLCIGQEGLADITQFTLEGKDRKTLRNGLNALSKKGFHVVHQKAPLEPEVLLQMYEVSDEWLGNLQRPEMGFAQGAFYQDVLRDHDIIALYDQEETMQAFLNIIPDYAEGEGTYDLIRKRRDAPGAAFDALIIHLISLLRAQGKETLNLGLVPMSGIELPNSLAERTIKFAYEQWKPFNRYKGQRFFKEKFATEWRNKYLFFTEDFDLIKLPAALKKVMESA